MIKTDLNPTKFYKISFRAGGAKEVVDQSLGQALKALSKLNRFIGRWSEKSTQYKRYADIPDIFLAKLTAGICRGEYLDVVSQLRW